MEEKCIPKIQNTGLEIPSLAQFGGKLEILRTTNL